MGNDENKHAVTRKRFLEQTGFLGGVALTGTLLGNDAAEAAQNAILNSRRPDAPYELDDPENILYSVCMNCNTGCGIKCKIQNGVLTKIDGSAYNPWAFFPHLPMKTSLAEAARIDGALCPKGQACIQTAYDPYRIRKVLKRDGPRGSNRWKTIDFDTAIKEIVEGGKLFSHVSGEEGRNVEGLKSIMALRDSKAFKSMSADIAAFWKEKDEAKRKEFLEVFKVKHAEHLDKLIDPNHPDFGPKNNQFTMMWGRLKGGRKDFMERFGQSYGTANLHGHTTVCQGSLYFTCKALSEQYLGGSFTDGQKFYWQSDLENAKFVLFVGANLFEANYGPTNRTVRLTENLATQRTKIAVVDPRFSKLASKAWKWLPIKPGGDLEMGLAIVRWMIENDRFDKKFLANANKAAAKASGELTYTNATWLVKIDPKSGEPGAFVRAADVGLATAEKRTDKTEKEEVEYEEKFLLVMKDGVPVSVDPKDESNAVTGDLFVDAALPDGTKVKSGFQLIKEAAFERSFEDWCKAADLDPKELAAVAKELTSYGKAASVDIHRGVSQHTNGFYSVLVFMTINAMLGNYDWKGGMSAASTYSYDGKKGGPYKLIENPGKISSFGISIIRHNVDYSRTSIFQGYPAKRNWYPIASDVYEEIIPSIGDQYPYPVKTLFLYMGTPVYSLPAGHTNIDILMDLKKTPLFFTSDIVIGTTSIYADYIFPDLSFLERWEFQGSHPNMTVKVQPVRQPVMAPIPEPCKVFGQEMPICFESLLMALAEKLNLKGFGQDAFGKGLHLNRPEDFYLRAVANIALGDKPDLSSSVPAASAEEINIFEKSRRHLPKSVYDASYWKGLVGLDIWPKLVYVLTRGGRFQEHAKAYKGDQLSNPYGKLLCLYQEKTAKNRYAGTGKHYAGYVRYVSQATYEGKPLDDLGRGYDLSMITHRTITQTKSRTISNYWLLPMMPENGILMNPVDATRLALKNDQKVKVVSSTNPEGEWDFKNGQKKPIIGHLKVTDLIRPGVVSFELGFGHWATGAQDVLIDGQVVKGDPRRAKGVHANAAMWTDPKIKNTCLFDPIGGSVSFYGTKVNLVPA